MQYCKRYRCWSLSLIAAAALACGKGNNTAPPRELAEYYTPIAGKVPYFKGADMNPFWSNKDRPLPGDLRQLKQFRLIDSEGKELTANALRGKFVLVSFFFSRCSGICPMVTASIRRMREQLPDKTDVVFVSITVDPDHDQPNQLVEFRERLKVPFADWYFATGEKQQIYGLARDVFQADVTVRGTKDAADFLHTESVYLLDKDLYLRGIYRTRGLADFGRLVKELGQLRAA